MRIGDSDAINVGDFVVAIGNPFGVGQTVTSGIVSAVGCSLTGAAGYEEFIQTDASINPGNSGGALVNLRGELIGINTAIIGPANVGIGFAVPSNMARAVVDQIVKYGEVKRGRVGVTTQDVTPDLAKRNSLSVTEGAYVESVEAKSPAEQGGLLPRDVVIAVNGRPVRTSGELRNRVGLTPVGEEIDLRVLRGGATRDLKIRIGDAAQAMADIPGEALPQLAGARVAQHVPRHAALRQARGRGGHERRARFGRIPERSAPRRRHLRHRPHARAQPRRTVHRPTQRRAAAAHLARARRCAAGAGDREGGCGLTRCVRRAC